MFNELADINLGELDLKMSESKFSSSSERGAGAPRSFGFSPRSHRERQSSLASRISNPFRPVRSVLFA